MDLETLGKSALVSLYLVGTIYFIFSSLQYRRMARLHRARVEALDLMVDRYLEGLRRLEILAAQYEDVADHYESEP